VAPRQNQRRAGIDLAERRQISQEFQLPPSRRSRQIEFIDENGGGPGVQLRKRHQKKRQVLRLFFANGPGSQGAGAEFIQENGRGPWVRLKKRQQKRKA
jgi:hypothetical protein